MIEKMTKYSFILLSADTEGFLSALQSLGVVDITRSEKAVDAASAALLGSIEKRRQLISETENGSDATLKGLEAECDALQKAADEQRVWGSYDRDALAATGISLHFYSVASKKYDPSWETQYAIQTVEDDGRTRWFVIAGDNAGFPLKELPSPSRNLSDLEAELSAAQDRAEEYRKTLEARKAELPALREGLSAMESDFERALAAASAESVAEETLAVLEGFAPADSCSAVDALIEECGVFCLKEEASAPDNPPIKLKNNWFSRQFEVLTDMYGRPVYDEFDPTPILAPFFLLFFAMCMGDAGYGILLMLIGWFLKKKVPSMADMAPLVSILGAGTFVVGIVLHTFFGINLYEAAWVPEGLKKIMISGSIAGYDAQMVLAVGVGIFHICLAMVVKSICYTQRFGFAKTVSTWGWTLLIVGAVLICGLALLGIMDKSLVKVALIALGVVSALGIFLFNDLHRNVFLNIGSGLWDSYNMVTGLMGDVLSYLRLYALGLAGGMLGNTFNLLAGMTLGIQIPGVNILLFIFIILIGHALNLALSCLGAFVHPLRLTFVEYFKNSGFEGTGKTYRPLK